MTHTKSLADELLAVPAAPPLSVRRHPESAFTSSLDIRGDEIEATLRAPESAIIDEGTALQYLEEEGLSASDWRATHFRKIKYGQGMQSVKVSFARVQPGDLEKPDIDGLIAKVQAHAAAPVTERPDGEHAFIVALGDMQFGKIDGDGVEGTLRRSLEYIDKAADRLAWYRQRFDIGHVHIAWLGDHIEGFQSQGGANVWRTPLPLSDQIRLTQEVMLHAAQTFAPLAKRVTMAAVPGNHGETTRFAGKGVTRYDDSYDTLALLNVQMAVKLAPEQYGHVEFYVPELDEMIVALELAGTIVAHVHGHQFSSGKHFSWWEGQAFGGSPLTDADLLLAGHLHHLHLEETGVKRGIKERLLNLLRGKAKREAQAKQVVGQRLFIQVPALESESTWYRHRKGTRGVPGIVVAITKDGWTATVEVVR